MTTATAAGVARAVASWLGAANLVAAALIWWQLEVLTPPSEGNAAANAGAGPLEELALAVPMLAVGSVLITRRVRGVLRWIDEGRTPTPAERDALLRQPSEQAARVQAGWVLVAAVVLGYNNATGDGGPAAEQVRTFLGISLGGTVASALSFLITERLLKPTWAVALAGAAPERSRTIGVRPRLLLAWALGSAIPVFGIGLGLLRPGGGGTTLDDVRAPLLFLVAVSLLVGGLLMVATAKTLGDPLDELRSAVDRVAHGDLDVTVPVDDGGEIGFLEAGFNRMAEGLRERRQLEDLFGRHVGIDVARQALAGGVRLGGEQRDVTVLFVDLAGSSLLGERMAPDRVVALLNQFFAAVVSCVTAEHGWVDKFEGDGALCVWGAPNDDPHHAEHALRAARSLRERLASLRATHAELDAGIGVASGPVVAGNIGTEERFEYTVIGDPVNEAARLTEAAKARRERLLASAAAVSAAGDEAQHWTAAGQVSLRGREHATAVHVPA